MTLVLSEEQRALRDIVRQFLAEKSPEAAVRTQMETERGHDPLVWRQMAEQLGLQALIVPEEFAGQGFGWSELVLVLAETGRALLCAPYLATVLATSALLASRDRAAQTELLPRIASGEVIATVAVAEPAGRWDAAGIETTATQDGGWRVTGVKSYVLDGHIAEVVLVFARTGRGLSLFQVAGDGTGVTRSALATMDSTRKLARIDLNGAEATLVGVDGDGERVLTELLDRAAVALAAEQLGGSEAVLEMAVGYAKQRVQFGQPIGAFQAVKHKCANLLLDVESARAAVAAATRCATLGTDDLSAMASMAKAFCSEAYFRAAAENIQVHGGIGFTWEHPAHLYYKRAKSSEVLFGDPTYHRELLAQHIGL